ncbi:hypothetical protein SAMN05421736_10117 [Evansella caseinilytica]|uniref:Nucleotidyltransferase family protein n=1 Tax=Evansella caseinilytica TaxID=1503961 RepID=A0A1H3G1G7_9BACI|nr:nucleotidyltransferase family protein [Evansella caseinilytica]SDX96254.1 hypothetical protein SAMN05421736_10117 [Evansella caseinilytica]
MRKLQSAEDVKLLIAEDHWMMDILHTVQSLHLPDWWVCAGFVRSKIWDALHGFEERTPLGDIDVIYFDPSDTEEAVEKRWEDQLRERSPGLPWSVKNQARMHRVNNVDPYVSSEDGISKFPETPTALGVKLDERQQLVLTAPCGIEDALKLRVRPTRFFHDRKELAAVYMERMAKKDWKTTWPGLTIYAYHELERQKEKSK